MADIVTREGRRDVLASIEAIRQAKLTEVVDAMVVEAERKAGQVLGILGEMLPDAAEAVYRALSSDDPVDLNPQKLKAAQFVLGVFGISDKKRIEVTHKTGDRDKMMEDLKSEFRKQIEKSQLRGAERVIKGVEAREVPE